MNYNIEYGNFVGGEWKSSLVVPFKEDFESAKAYIIESAKTIKGEFDFATSDGDYICVRMIEDSDEKRPARIIHYITPHHPNVSLPSTK